MRYVLVCACVVAALVGCARPKPAEPLLPALSAAEISGDRLWKRVTVDSDYDNYHNWPGLEGMHLGQSPHGKYHEVYVNAALARALPIASRKAPDGSIIVKENFNADKVLSNVTVMAKVSGFDPDNGDWFWASYDPQGKVNAAGKLEACAACHAGVKDNDYVILHQLDAPLPSGWK